MVAKSVLPCSAQGLKFLNADAPIDQRTSYKVFDTISPVFKGECDIEFDMSLYPINEIGYVLRIKFDKTKKIYNLFYDGRGDNFFKLNEEGRSTLIVAPIDREELLGMRWFKVKLSFFPAADSIGITIHDRSFGTSGVDVPDRFAPNIYFGRSDYVIDVPSFAIRNIAVGNLAKRYRFSLCQSGGNTVYDSAGRGYGRVDNPEWLITNAYHWQFKAEFRSSTPASAGYNSSRREFYLFNRDSIATFNVRTEVNEWRRFNGRCPVEISLGTSFVDRSGTKLYAYETYYEDDDEHRLPTVASYNFASQQWQVESYDPLPSQLHHHSGWYDPVNQCYTIFGGFGNMAYSSFFECYSIGDGHWNRLPTCEGDKIWPRYFSSMGYLPDNNSLYVFGGMGNESGEQAVGRIYFYDLYRIDLNTRTITKMWEIPHDGINTVPVRGMIVPNENYFYTFCYPESVSNSYLKLYRYSIKDGSYEIVGDSLPMRSDKITTNANLYYDANTNELYATIQESSDDVSSTVRLYSLSFPPFTAEGVYQMTSPERAARLKMLWTLAFVGSLLVVVIILVVIRVRRYRRDAELALLRKRRTVTELPPVPNSIVLFGDFGARDRNNRDIAYMFTSSQRQILCLVMQYNNEGGITSQRLSDLLWPDKPESKAKNSRGVAINHLRTTLAEMDGIQLTFENGRFRFDFRPPFYCDYLRVGEIVSSGLPDSHRDELLAILSRGKFLKFSDLPILDSFKSSVERELEPLLQTEISKSYSSGNYLATIDLAEALFNIDPLNDEVFTLLLRSLAKLKRTEEVAIRYKAFALEYRETFDADYPRSLKNIL